MNIIIQKIIQAVIDELEKHHKFPERIGLSKRQYYAYIEERKVTGRITFKYHGEEYELPECRKCF